MDTDDFASEQRERKWSEEVTKFTEPGKAGQGKVCGVRGEGNVDLHRASRTCSSAHSFHVSDSTCLNCLWPLLDLLKQSLVDRKSVV